MIQEYRKKLDNIDDKVTSLLLERLALVKKIGQEKQKQHIAVLDKGREEAIKERLALHCNSDEEKAYILTIYESIMNQSKRVQSYH